MLKRVLILIVSLSFFGCTSMLVGGSSGGASESRPERSESSMAADGEISAAVRSKLHADSYTSSAAINVSAYEGRVTLRGVVPSYGAREQAGKLATATAGVVRVNNELTVRPQQ